MVCHVQVRDDHFCRIVNSFQGLLYTVSKHNLSCIGTPTRDTGSMTENAALEINIASAISYNCLSS